MRRDHRRTEIDLVARKKFYGDTARSFINRHQAKMLNSVRHGNTKAVADELRSILAQVQGTCADVGGDPADAIAIQAAIDDELRLLEAQAQAADNQQAAEEEMAHYIRSYEAS